VRSLRAALAASAAPGKGTVASLAHAEIRRRFGVSGQARADASRPPSVTAPHRRRLEVGGGFGVAAGSCVRRPAMQQARMRAPGRSRQCPDAAPFGEAVA